MRHYCRRRIARWLIVPIGLGLTLPTPALALRPRADTAGLEDALHPAAGLEENAAFAGPLDDRPDLPEVAAGEFTVITGGQVKTLSAVICMICAIYTPGRAGPALLAHLDPDATRYPTSYRRLAAKAIERGLDVARARVVLLKDTLPQEVDRAPAMYRNVRRSVQRAFRRLGKTLQDSQVVKGENEWGVVLDADTGRLFELRKDSILDDSPAAQAAWARVNDFERRWKTGERPILRYVELQSPAPAAGLEEDDNFIFELARSDKPLTAEDVYAVNAWVRQIPRYSEEGHVQRVVKWANAVQRGRAAASRRLARSRQRFKFTSWGLNSDDPVTLAALTYWLLTPSRHVFTDATHRTAWLTMLILLHRAGYPMMAFPVDKLDEDGHRRLGQTIDPRPLVEFVRQEVSRAIETPYTLMPARVTNLADGAGLYRMLVRQPEGVKTPCELFTTTGPVRIVCEDEATRDVVRRLVEEAPATGALPGLTDNAVTIEMQRPGMALEDPSTHTILVRRSGGVAISNSTPAVARRLAIVTLTSDIRTFADLLRDALAQWANRPLASIRPFQRAIFRGRRLDLYA